MRRFVYNEARRFTLAIPPPLPYSTSSNSNWVNVIGALAHHAQSGTELASLFEASRILNSGTKPNSFALSNLLRSTTDLGHHSFGIQLHGYVLRSGNLSDVYVSASLIRLYLRMHSLNDAHELFDEMPQPNVVSWNTLISGCVRAGQFQKALSLFTRLERSGVCAADSFSFTAALSACGQLSLFVSGSSIHCKMVKLGMVNGGTVVVANCLIDMYGKCRSVEDAVRVFYEIVEKDVISWNSAIAALASNGNIELSYEFLRLMPNPDTVSYNGLINGVARAGNIEDAVRILLTMPSPNSSSWNSVITGFVNRNRAREALDLFRRMHSRNVEMDEFTFSVIFNGIADIPALLWGTLIHCCAIKCGLDKSVTVGSALIDMYSKCGQVKNAELEFHAMPGKNLISWNAMISGYARNGDSVRVIELFESLKREERNTKPDSITFLNLLSACSHYQIPFEVAVCYFESMINEYGISPSIEHCCSMIRVMGEKGELWRAERMIRELGFESYGVVWRALLGACGTQRDLEVAEIAASKAIELESDEDYVYVKLSNMYASFGRWEDVGMIRGFMSKRRVRKETGSSWIEVESHAM